MSICYFAQLWAKQAFSAAHERTFGLIDRLILNNRSIAFITPQDTKKGDDLKQYLGVKLFQADPSNSSQVNFVLQKQQNPIAAIYDTTISEQLYSHYFHQLYPNALQILDLQDLHSLRLSREEIIKQYPNLLQPFQVLSANPDIQQQIFEREMASIVRSDLIFTCSDYEQILLNKLLKNSIKKIELMTFFYPMKVHLEVEEKEMNKIKQEYNRRKHFVFLGNQLHRPNLDSVQYLLKNIWPSIRNALPDAQLHIYGSNFQQGIKSDVENGVICKGLMQDLVQLSKYKVMLAPLRYGAGVKGKITDAWRELLPVVTTPIGAEGLFFQSPNQRLYYALNLKSKVDFYQEINEDNLSAETRKKALEEENLINRYYMYNSQIECQKLGKQLIFGGSFNNWTDQEFIESSIQIYSDQYEWRKAQNYGTEILKFRMDMQTLYKLYINFKTLQRNVNELAFFKNFTECQSQLGLMRKNDILQKLTWNETMRSNYHFAKYLNEKRLKQELIFKNKLSE